MVKFQRLRKVLGFHDNAHQLQESKAKKVRKKKFTPQEIFQLKNGIHAACRGLTSEDWKKHFYALDLQQRGWLSFDDFRRTVRRAGITPSVISDDELERIVSIVDADGSGQIDLEEFLSFIRPSFIPDVICTASSFLETTNDSDRNPGNLVNSIGVSVTEDNCYVHTGDLDGNTWTSEMHLKESPFVQFELPRVYFINQIHLWNFMSLNPRTQKEENKCALKEFDITYSLNGRHWYFLGRVDNLPPIPSTGYFKYYGECIQNKSYGGKDKMPYAHRKAALVEIDDCLGLPAKFIKFSNMVNCGGKAFGLNGIYIYGAEAIGDCIRSNEGLEEVPKSVYSVYQYVLYLNLSHNRLRELPKIMERLVLLQRLDISYNHFEEFPKVLLRGDFRATLTSLDLSHNLLKRLSPSVGQLQNLQELLLSGHFWGPDSLPAELGNLDLLVKLDLNGLPYIHDWLWNEEARRRHALGPSSHGDHFRITLQQFLAYVAEHPLLSVTFGPAAASSLFHRFDGRKAITLDKDYEPYLSLVEAASLDDMLIQVLSKPFCGIPDSVWNLPHLKQLRLERSGIESYRYKGNLPTLPAVGLSRMIQGANKLGIFTLLEDQAKSCAGTIHVKLPSISNVLDAELTERVLRERGMFDDKKPSAAAIAEPAQPQEISRVMKQDRKEFSLYLNPQLSSVPAACFVDFSGDTKTVSITINICKSFGVQKWYTLYRSKSAISANRCYVLTKA